MKIYKLAIIAILAAFLIGACDTPTAVNEEETNKSTNEMTEEKKEETTSANLDSPTAAIKAFVEAAKAEDEDAVKKTLSEKSVKMIDLMTSVTGKTFLETLSADDKDEEYKELPEMRNEKIDGDTATLEVKGKSDKEFDTIPFVKEDGSWKIAFLDEQYDKDFEKMSKEAEKMKKDKEGSEDSGDAESDK